MPSQKPQAPTVKIFSPGKKARQPEKNFSFGERHFVICNKGEEPWPVSVRGLEIHAGDEKKMNACPNLAGLRALVRLVVLAGCLLPWSACNPQAKKPPPPEVSASVVVTQDGTAFYVKGLRIPGTRQELRLKESDTLTWVPLEQVMAVWFTGPIRETYRRAIILLTGGEQLQGEVYGNFLIEGATDLGYWNMPMSKVDRLKLAFD